MLTTLDRPKSDHIETATDPSVFASWPDEVYREMLDNQDNGMVGSQLVSETEKLRVWHLHLDPGQRLAFHRHVNPYFWSALTAGRARTYFSDGRIVEVDYTQGQTQHYHYAPGEYMLHALENIGDAVLSFATVEFLENPGAALSIPDHARL